MGNHLGIGIGDYAYENGHKTSGIKAHTGARRVAGERLLGLFVPREDVFNLAAGIGIIAAFFAYWLAYESQEKN